MVAAGVASRSESGAEGLAGRPRTRRSGASKRWRRANAQASRSGGVRRRWWACGGCPRAG
eukprot:3885365-Prymnesium_polylepis.1